MECKCYRVQYATEYSMLNILFSYLCWWDTLDTLDTLDTFTGTREVRAPALVRNFTMHFHTRTVTPAQSRNYTRRLRNGGDTYSYSTSFIANPCTGLAWRAISVLYIETTGTKLVPPRFTLSSSGSQHQLCIVGPCMQHYCSLYLCSF
jgi:hypothetical protein